VLCSTTSLYVGPLADVAGGVDLSFVAGGVTAALAYLAIRVVFPETKRDAPAREPALGYSAIAVPAAEG
jgi:hypothetical protein